MSRVVVVTGGALGMGLGISRHLSRAGYRMAVLGVDVARPSGRPRSYEPVARVAFAAEVDVSNRAAVDEAVNNVRRRIRAANGAVAVIGTCPHLSAAHNPGGSDAQIAGRGAQNDASSPNVATPESAGSERAPRRPSAPTPATAPGHGIPTSFLTTPYRAVGANRRTVYATGQQARTKITMAVATPLAPLTRRAVTHRCA